jgi:glycosyltransferase involved in cell wall biosynthesis
MRILLGHTFYRSEFPSGEDAVYRNERELIERAGHEVIPFERHNDDIGESFGARARTAAAAVWSTRTERDLAALIAQQRPDVAHFHNTFPQISPSAYRTCTRLGVPVVQTLHNYRLICPGALLMREGRPCEQCIDGSLLNAIAHSCYRDSKLASATVVTMLAANRALGTYRNAVDCYIALTEFARERFIRAGLPADRLTVRPNFLSEPPAPGAGDGNYALYVGRLSAEKGVRTLVAAWDRITELPLKILGDGILRAELEAHVRSRGSRVEFLGFAPRSEVYEAIRAATLQIIPSECYEGFPVTVLEALAAGTPLAVSAIGALNTVVAEASGTKFPAGDPAALADAVKRLLATPGALERARAFNREHYDAHYSQARAIDSLIGIYGTARQRQRYGT